MGKLSLPPIDRVADKVHQAWICSKQDMGIYTRKAEDGEELMVPYAELSERQKNVDRQTVMTVYKAIEECSGE